MPRLGKKMCENSGVEAQRAEVRVPKGREQERVLEEGAASPFPPAKGSDGALLALPWGLGQSPSRNRIWCILDLKSHIWWQQFL